MHTIAFLGDVMLGRGVDEQIPKRDPASFWGDTLDTLRDADAVIANLECAITDHTRPWHPPKVFHFRARPAAVEILKAASVDAVSLANNHSLDFQRQGLLDTLDHLDEAGIAHAGAGRTIDEAAAPALLELPGLTIALIASTDNERAFAATPEKPGTSYIPTAPHEDYVIERLRRSIDAAHALEPDLTILSLHWGPNMTTHPPPHFRRFAHKAIDLGVDVIHGHSAHVFHPVEAYRTRPIMYDCGDALDDYARDPDLRNDWSFIFLLDVESRKPARLRMIPIQLDYALTNIATGDTADAICERMIHRCRKHLDTDLLRTDDTLTLPLT